MITFNSNLSYNLGNISNLESSIIRGSLLGLPEAYTFSYTLTPDLKLLEKQAIYFSDTLSSTGLMTSQRIARYYSGKEFKRDLEKAYLYSYYLAICIGCLKDLTEPEYISLVKSNRMLIGHRTLCDLLHKGILCEPPCSNKSHVDIMFKFDKSRYSTILSDISEHHYFKQWFSEPREMVNNGTLDSLLQLIDECIDCMEVSNSPDYCDTSTLGFSSPIGDAHFNKSKSSIYFTHTKINPEKDPLSIFWCLSNFVTLVSSDLPLDKFQSVFSKISASEYSSKRLLDFELKSITNWSRETAERLVNGNPIEFEKGQNSTEVSGLATSQNDKPSKPTFTNNNRNNSRGLKKLVDRAVKREVQDALKKGLLDGDSVNKTIILEVGKYLFSEFITKLGLKHLEREKSNDAIVKPSTNFA